MKLIIAWLLTTEQNEIGQLIMLIFQSLYITCWSQVHALLFPEDTTYAVSFKESLHILQTFNQNSLICFQENCHIIYWCLCKGPLSLELEYSYSLSTALWAIDSQIPNLYKICSTIQALARFPYMWHSKSIFFFRFRESQIV